MLQPPAFPTPPPSPPVRYLFWAAPASGTCMPCMRMHAYTFICMNIRTYMSTSTYACMAYACRHMPYACNTSMCMHGMRAYMHA